MTQKEAIAKAPKGRVRRQGLGRRQVLTVSGKEPGFVYRVVNDEGDRVASLQEIGYEVVTSKEGVKVGDNRIGNASSEGTAVQMSVGGGKKGILMRIPEEFYTEDQADKQNHVNQIEQATKEKALDGTYGELRIGRS